MNIWLLGNGFDLAHTLPTKYENFIHTMEFLLNHEEEKFETVGDIFGNEELQRKDPFIKASYEKYAEYYDEIQFPKYALKNFLSRECMEIEGINSSWLKYFIKCFNRDLGWIDFEKEIATVVKCFKKLLKDHDNSEELSKRNMSIIKIDDLTEEQKVVFKSFNFFYEDSKASPSIKMIRKEYLNENPYVSLKKELIAENLYESLRVFAMLFCQYLNVFVESLLAKLGETITAFSQINNSYYIISFNYSNTAEKLYKKEPIHHIHGNDFSCFIGSFLASIKDMEHGIVLGINSDKDDKVETVDTLFLNFKKYYQRVMYDTDISYLNTIEEIKNYKAKKKHDEICLSVVGHSLDVTDEDIIRELFDLADNITIYCHTKSETGKYIKNLVTLYGRAGFDNLRKNKRLLFTGPYYYQTK